MRILYAVCDQGLGHATRSTPLIESLLPENRLLLLSAGSALAYLKTRFGKEGGVSLVACPAYPPLLRGWGRPLYPLRLAADTAAFQAALWREQALCAELVRRWRPDVIISDARYGVARRDIPSYVITHQLRILLPGFLRWGKAAVRRENLRRLARFRRVLVPDHAGSPLSGRLSRIQDGFIPGRLAFPGHLSALAGRKPASADPFRALSAPAARIARRPDILCLAGGYLLEQKRDFLARARAQLLRLGRPAVIAGGDPGSGAARLPAPHLLEISHAQGDLLREMFTRARTVVGRSGYSTVMDLAEHPKPAYLVPTPGQFEQEYLARHIQEAGHAHCTRQDRLDIAAWWENGPADNWPRLSPTGHNLPRFREAMGLG